MLDEQEENTATADAADAPEGAVSAEALQEDPGAPEGRAPEEVAVGEERAREAAEAGAAAATEDQSDG